MFDKLLFILIPYLFSTSLLAEEKTKEYIFGKPVDPFIQRTGVWPVEERNIDRPRQALDYSEVLRQIPGVQARGDLSAGSPLWSLRGSGSGTRTLALYNGTPINFADGAGPISLLVPRESVAKITLLKGPGSLFFGSDAISGALNFEPQQFENNSATARVGSFGQTSYIAESPVFQKEGQFVQLSGYYDFTQGNFPYRNDRLSRSGTREFNNRTTHRLNLYGNQKTQWGEWTQSMVYAHEAGSTPGSLTQPYINDFDNTGVLGSLQLSKKISSDFSGSFKIHHVNYETKSEQRAPAFSYNGKSSKTLGTIQIHQLTSETGSLDYFVDHSIDRHQSSGLNNTEFTSSNPEMGVIFRDFLFSDWYVQPGLRLIPQYNHAVPSLGLFQEQDTGRVWASYSEGFRNPTLGQRYASTSYVLGNKDLKPEKSRQVEIGFVQKPQESYLYGASVFHIFYDQLIASASLGSQTTYVNIESANVFGFDLHMQFNHGAWEGKLGVSHLKTEDHKKAPLPMSPQNQVTGSLGYKAGYIFIELIDTYWTGYYDRDFVTGGLVPLGPWNVVDLYISTVDLAPWHISGGITNIFDISRELTLDYPEPQRRLFAQLTRDL